MQFKDYYQLLGVPEGATADQIKSAYRKLARTLHPDVNKAADAHRRFTDLGEAYEVLSDPKKRAAYDELRRGGWREGQELPPGGYPDASQGGAGHGAGQRPEFTDIYGDDFSEFFHSLFGNMGPGPGAGARRRRRTPHWERGEDLRHTLSISLEEAYRGTQRELHVQLPADQMAQDVRSHSRTLHVKIPAGVAAGEQIRLRGQGMAGPDASRNGDLYLEIQHAPHPFFRVEGRDVLLDLPLAPWEAVLGARVVAPTLGGAVDVTIPAGAQDGQRLRLKGRGLPGDPPGDQYVILRLSMPPSVSGRATELWRQLAAESTYNPRQGLGV